MRKRSRELCLKCLSLSDWSHIRFYGKKVLICLECACIFTVQSHCAICFVNKIVLHNILKVHLSSSMCLQGFELHGFVSFLREVHSCTPAFWTQNRSVPVSSVCCIFSITVQTKLIFKLRNETWNNNNKQWKTYSNLKRMIDLKYSRLTEV